MISEIVFEAPGSSIYVRVGQYLGMNAIDLAYPGRKTLQEFRLVLR